MPSPLTLGVEYYKQLLLQGHLSNSKKLSTLATTRLLRKDGLTVEAARANEEPQKSVPQCPQRKTQKEE